MKINRKKDNSNHTKFGGLIFMTDFNTNAPRLNNFDSGSEIARRIEQDKKFDSYCKNILIHNAAYRNSINVAEGEN